MAKKPAQLYFTDDVEARRLIASDPMALLIGFALDQQVTVQNAFDGPRAIKERLGTLDPATLANTDLEPIFREKPAIHRYPGNMSKRISALAAAVENDYDGDASKVWKSAKSPDELLKNVLALPGFGDLSAHALIGALAFRFGVRNAEPLVPDHPMLGEVTSIDELEAYQAAKKLHRKEWYAIYGKKKG
ncbi:MAG: DNA repair protein [Solirubrobacterales bacterium]